MKWIVPFALLALIGVALWQFTGPEQESSRGTGEAAGPGVEEQAAAPTGASELSGAEAAEDLDAAVERTVSVAQAREGASLLAAAGESEPNDRLIGRVLDDRGRPVPGAEVKLKPNPGRRMVVFESLDSVVALSDSEGRFRLERHAGELQVRAEGFEPLDRPVAASSDDGDQDLGDISLSAGPVLEGFVVDADGRPVAGAAVSMSAGEDGGFRLLGIEPQPDVVTDSRGGFLLGSVRLGEYRLTVDTEQHPRGTFDGFTDTPGRLSEPLRLQLERGGTIAGTVTGAPADMDGLRVQCQAAQSEGGLLDLLSFSERKSAELASDGSFLLEGLRLEREYELVVVLEEDSGISNPFETPERSTPVRAVTGERGVVLEYTTGAGLRVQVVDAATNEPIEDVEVRFGPEWNRSSRGSSWPAGRVELSELDGGDNGLLAAQPQLELRAEGYQTVLLGELQLTPGEILDLGITRMHSAPMVEVSVYDQLTGEPIKGARVELRPDTSGAVPGGSSVQVSFSTSRDGGTPVLQDRTRVHRARTDEEGRAQLTSFPGERAKLTVRATKYADFQLAGQQLSSSGATELEAPMGLAAEVTVTVLDASGQPIVGMQVKHRDADQASGGPDAFIMSGAGFAGHDKKTDDQGQLVFEGLSEGRHGFRTSAPGQEGAVRMVVNGLANDDQETEDWTWLDVAYGGNYELELQSEALIGVGGLVLEGGAPLVGATIEVASDKQDAGQAMLASWGGLGRGGGLRTDAEGRWSKEGLEPGDYVLTVKHPRRAMPSTRAFELTRDGQQVDLDLSVTTISGRVTDDSGRPVVGAEVSAAAAGGLGGARRISMIFQGAGGGAMSMGGSEDRTITDEDGRYELRGVLADTPLTISVDPASDGTNLSPASVEDVEVAEGKVRSGVDLVLGAGANIEVKLVDAAGNPASGYLLTARKTDVQTEVPRVEFVQGGESSLQGLEPGSWTLQVQALQGGSPEPLEQIVELAQGETLEVRFDVP